MPSRATRPRAAPLALLLLLAAAHPLSSAREPPGPWLGPIHGAVPASIAGGRLLHTQGLAALIVRAHPILLDVADAPRRPARMAAGALWLPVPHPDIPGSLWIPGAGLGAIPPAAALALATRLAAATGANPDRPIVVYCHQQCWNSWNAARRLVWLGYRQVFWDPDGIEGWQASGRPLATAPAP